ncbi:hypothetical protein [Rathayibacter tanaceti]|uniref:Uncharacterized protein n=2 Tax=Rathayibacter tanaceti TaxID=1671680 RepID=A0A162GTE4_9MICO|nr:hypothetical protein [Rathayibacter tanaceti]KZX22338.1 hypothetical protein ACH61_00491 [Rathayibacter tanaceti]QHC54621.1 hypothetical protein GSU10_02430 [Rathayibacter tanaceti]TCO37579.1 hypothetical protein EV639_104248 [Rathayibacter tanaceti]
MDILTGAPVPLSGPAASELASVAVVIGGRQATPGEVEARSPHPEPGQVNVGERVRDVAALPVRRRAARAAP